MQLHKPPNDYVLLDDAHTINADYQWVRDVTEDDERPKRISVTLNNLGFVGQTSVVASLEYVGVFGPDVIETEDLVGDVEESEAFEAAWEFMQNTTEW